MFHVFVMFAVFDLFVLFVIFVKFVVFSIITVCCVVAHSCVMLVFYCILLSCIISSKPTVLRSNLFLYFVVELLHYPGSTYRI